MIGLTKLNGTPIMVNAAHIESVEACPDTRVALTNGKQMYVREDPDAVRELACQWFQRIGAWHAVCGGSTSTRDAGDLEAGTDTH